MELHPSFYTENPFTYDIAFRVKGAFGLDENDLYSLFIKNLIAFVYYETDFTSLTKNELKAELPTTQNDLYALYYKGKLQTKDSSKELRSPIIKYCKFEMSFIQDTSDLHLYTYLQFIKDFSFVFQRIDILVDLKPSSTMDMDYLEYLNANNFIYPHLNLLGVGRELENFFIEVCKHLTECYIIHLDDSFLTDNDFIIPLQRIGLAMKLDLLEPEDQDLIIKYSYNWLSQRFKDFAIRKQIYFDVNEDDGPFVFEPILQLFLHYFSPNTKSKEIMDYPKYIFSSYAGYLLFDTIAKELSVFSAVSYVYRLLHEKRLIVVTDTKFRDWFNRQDYPIQLEGTTATLIKSTKPEREQFVSIIASLLDVDIEN